MPLTDEQREEVADLVERELNGEEPGLLGRVLFELTYDDKHNATLYRLRGKQAAFKQYLQNLISQVLEADARQHGASGDAERIFDEYQERFRRAPPARQRSLLARLQKHGFAGASVTLAPSSTVALQAAEQVLANEGLKAIVTWEATGVLNAFDRVTTLSKWTPMMARAGNILTAGLLAKEIYTNVRQWRRGEIDGVACTRNIASSLAATGAGFALGGLVGTIAGPVGVIVGGILGALAAGEFVQGTFDLFAGDDRARAMKLAYQKLGLQPDASHDQVVESYRRLAKQTHPDKGGDQAKFVEINLAYEMIRAERLP